MKKSTLAISILALAALIVVPLVYAGPGREHGMAGFGPLARLERAQQELGLSDQQVGEIKTIFKGLHEQNAAYRDQLRGGLQGVMNTLLKNPNDIATAQALIDQQAQAERAMKMNMINARSSAR
jgi:hypothetical protein